MKKSFIYSLLSLTIFVFSHNCGAQSYQQGEKYLGFGVGIGNTLIYKKAGTVVPPLTASFEYAISDKLSAGGFIGMCSAVEDVSLTGIGTWKWRYTHFFFGVKGNLHFATGPKLDPYAGLLLGYNAASISYEKPPLFSGTNLKEPSASGPLVGVHVGARYLLTQRLSGFAELGYGIAVFQLGVTVKI